MWNELYNAAVKVQNSRTISPFIDYYKAKVKSIIRRDYIYPQIKSMLKRLYNDSETTIVKFSELKNEFISKIPLEGYGDLGTFYSNIVENYIGSSDGESFSNISLSSRATT